MSIRLYDSKLGGEEIHKYVFIVEKFSKLGSELYSKPFHFGGHQWKIQANLKDKRHFGVFLRWLGGGELTKGVKCKLNFTLGKSRDFQRNVDSTKEICSVSTLLLRRLAEFSRSFGRIVIISTVFKDQVKQ